MNIWQKLVLFLALMLALLTGGIIIGHVMDHMNQQARADAAGKRAQEREKKALVLEKAAQDATARADEHAAAKREATAKVQVSDKKFAQLKAAFDAQVRAQAAALPTETITQERDALRDEVASASVALEAAQATITDRDGVIRQQGLEIADLRIANTNLQGAMREERQRAVERELQLQAQAAANRSDRWRVGVKGFFIGLGADEAISLILGRRK